ncbi:hypothetical protein BDR22DRAFT_865340 [Usnea florida]
MGRNFSYTTMFIHLSYRITANSLHQSDPSPPHEVSFPPSTKLPSVLRSVIRPIYPVYPNPFTEPILPPNESPFFRALAPTWSTHRVCKNPRVEREKRWLESHGK